MPADPRLLTPELEPDDWKVMYETALQELKLFRKMLWLSHGCPISALYGDDGQMQCNLCRIDFKHQSAAEIQSVWRIRGEEWFREAQEKETA